MFTVKWRKYDKTELNLETIPFCKENCYWSFTLAQWNNNEITCI